MYECKLIMKLKVNPCADADVFKKSFERGSLFWSQLVTPDILMFISKFHR